MLAKAMESCLYLVTDSTPRILKGRDLIDVVSKALEGGVSIVQYRDKTSETAVLIETGRRLHEVCKRHEIPLLINDRVDVVLAIGCEGVHIGQDDNGLSPPQERYWARMLSSASRSVTRTRPGLLTSTSQRTLDPATLALEQSLLQLPKTTPRLSLAPQESKTFSKI